MSSRPTPDDHELDDFLAGRSPLSAAYREAARAETAPTHFDAQILQAAGQMAEYAAAPRLVASEPLRKRTMAMSDEAMRAAGGSMSAPALPPVPPPVPRPAPLWLRPLAFAASFVLALGLVLEVWREPASRPAAVAENSAEAVAPDDSAQLKQQGLVLPAGGAGPAVALDAAPLPRPADVEPVIAPRLEMAAPADRRPGQPREREREAESDRLRAEEAKRELPKAKSSAFGALKAEPPMAPAAAQAESRAAELPADATVPAPAPMAASPAAPEPATAPAEGVVVITGSRASRKSASPAAMADRAAESALPESAPSESAEHWMERIRELLRREQTEAARAEIARLLQAYPALELPEDLKPLAPPPR